MEPTLTRQTPAQHIVWLDVVRLVAMFTVVCCHCTDPFNFYPGTSPDIVDIKFWGAVYGAALRPCVPLFVMITGALLLPVRGDASAFYKKRIPRVFFPFLIWSVIYNLFPWITGLLGVEPKVILDFFPYPARFLMVKTAGRNSDHQSFLHIDSRKIKITLLSVTGYIYINPFLSADSMYLIIQFSVICGSDHHIRHRKIRPLHRTCEQFHIASFTKFHHLHSNLRCNDSDISGK